MEERHEERSSSKIAKIPKQVRSYIVEGISAKNAIFLINLPKFQDRYLFVHLME